ncbi:GNAT family N-acetyltransferase [Nocardia sp. NBC_00403]|uniref:GNAT family N-acetyltransferase n=1 Tax=Nocardia sp. NBC_00403 TaxID=2975990 RepID=UPI002E1D5C6D
MFLNEVSAPGYLEYISGSGPPVIEIRRGASADLPGVVRALAVGSKHAFRNFAGDVDGYVRDLALRNFEQLGRRTTCEESKFLVAVTADNEVAGYILTTFESRGEVSILGLYVHPNWHRQGIASDLLRAVLDLRNAAGIHMGDAGVRVGTTIGTDALQWYKNRSFLEVGDPTETPPAMQRFGLHRPAPDSAQRGEALGAPQQSLYLPARSAT